ncbi:histidine-containing phosphotransfer protein 1 isoform X2 [Ziziphus jujuba]|uniref:Histidine-containing phosphotransfer protein n=1 Tax=Ziziphus jujuba TaxID=326968 RepID=A0A6P6FXE7_ZIZJJ|nr:histidine-containing phosphotransfer protein 1 isoform X2 [Ziziphus jujuba]
MLICIPGVNPQGTMQNSWQSDNHCLSNLSLKLLYLHAELFHSHHGLLEEYVQSLFDEGIVNDQFSQIQTLKSMEQPDLVVQLIDAYLVDVEMILSELTSYSDFPDVDFSKVTLLAHKVKDRSSCIGAEHVRLACDELIQASVQMNKQNFVRALSWIKKEFSCTQDKLESYAQHGHADGA